MSSQSSTAPTGIANEVNIRIFDTTLRDGEQSPGASLNLQEKLEIARQLDALGVDVIEAGFPITSQGDFEAVHAIAHEGHQCHHRRSGTLRGSRHRPGRRGYSRARLTRASTFFGVPPAKSTSNTNAQSHRRDLACLSVDSGETGQAIRRGRGVHPGRRFPPCTELSVLVDITAAVVEAGATTVNITDTVGNAVPARVRAHFQVCA